MKDLTIRQNAHGPRTLMFATLAALAAPAFADDSGAPSVTFSRDVAPILQANCQACHRPGESGPMSLLTWEEARPWAKSMARAVESREMPPWHADPAVGEWANDRRLSDGEIETIVRWAGSGALPGDPADLPPPREFTEGWNIGEPDKIVYISRREITVPADAEDLYKYFVVNPGFTEDVWVEAVEARAGNPEVVHHLLAKSIGPKEGVRDPATDSVGWLGSMAPGRPADEFAPGQARLIRAGSLVAFEVHYHKEKGVEMKDRSMIGLRYARGPIRQAVSNMRLYFEDIRIPPGEPDYRLVFEDEFQQDVHFHTIMPHMHYRAQSMRVTAVYPGGREVPLLHVPRWDFNWQTTYKMKEPKAIPAGTRIRVEASYDNSADNPANPDPTVEVVSGEATTDEMMVAFIDYTVDGEDITAGRRIETMPPKHITGGRVGAEISARAD